MRGRGGVRFCDYISQKEADKLRKMKVWHAVTTSPLTALRNVGTISAS